MVNWSQACGQRSLLFSHRNAVDPSHWCLQNSIESPDTGMANPQGCYFGR
jgi:hypothetical protein